MKCRGLCRRWSVPGSCRRGARAGFDWTEIEPVIAKLREELDEFEQALSEGDSDRAASELGDVFSAVNLARHQKTEPETVLRQANLKFEDRFRWVEARLVQNPDR